MTRLAAILLTCVIACSVAGAAQRGPESPFVDPSKPGVFLSFVRLGKVDPLYVGESGQGVFFRLHNNMRWDLLVDMGGVPARNGDAELFYEIIEDPQGFPPSPLPIGRRRLDVRSVNALELGQSIVFSVPKEHIWEGLGIRVSFNYSWEAKDRPGIPGPSEPEHTVTFYHSALPERLRRGERRRPLIGEPLGVPAPKAIPSELPKDLAPPVIAPADPVQSKQVPHSPPL